MRPPRPDRFQPNRLLEVTPGFLENVVRCLRRSGLDIVSLDEMHRRLTERDFQRRFVCMTFDDGYRDTLQWAYPILKKYEMPFAIYIPTSFPDRLGELWWLALEAVIARNERVGLLINGKELASNAATVEEKRAAVRQALLAGCAACRPRTNCAASCAICARATRSTSRRSATSCA